MSARVFVIGASLGGIQALTRLLSMLPSGFPAPIFVTQHIGRESLGVLPRMLASSSTLPVRHAVSGESFESGVVYVAPPDRHMVILDACVMLSRGPRENMMRPAIDPLFRSAAVAYGAAVVGVVLTGLLDDGTAGLAAIKDQGGTAIVQDPQDCEAPSMPRSALRHVKVDHCRKLIDMPSLFLDLAKDDPPAPPAKGSGTLAELETRTAAGTGEAEDWNALEEFCMPSGLNCPVCRSALYELADQPILRFRCRSGHALSGESLLVAQTEEREALLSSVFGALMEESHLAKRMRNDPSYAGDEELMAGLASRVTRLEKEALQLNDWLRGSDEPG